MRVTLTRLSPLLLVLCLAGCGQTGPLFLRMPDSAVPARLFAPPINTRVAPVLALPGTTILAPVSATAPRPPATATRATPAAATRPAPDASTHA